MEDNQNKYSLLVQTIYLGTLGFVFILLIILGIYLGVWLDGKLNGFSVAWMLNLIILGVIVGAVNVYLMIKE